MLNEFHWDDLRVDHGLIGGKRVAIGRLLHGLILLGLLSFRLDFLFGMGLGGIQLVPCLTSPRCGPLGLVTFIGYTNSNKVFFVSGSRE